MLEHVNHPFICNLRYSFQDIEYMYGRVPSRDPDDCTECSQSSAGTSWWI